MSLRDRIVEIVSEAGMDYKEKTRTLLNVTCPSCGQSDKFSIIKENGACVCYRGSCSFGKQWFPDWVASTFNIDQKAARQKVYGDQGNLAGPSIAKNGWNLNIKIKSADDEEKTEAEKILESIKEVKYPEFHMYSMDEANSAEGLAYLNSRGITKEVASKYEVCYSKAYRRVYFPITMHGVTYGYQGRAIDKVEPGFRMRNNDGFHREALVMFADNLIGSDFAIMAEGPFDALKFELVGSNVCTMGKVVTDKQLAIIKSYDIKRLYLALDDDAFAEMNNLAWKAGVEVYRIFVPESCRIRCALEGKKPDFGECTMEEAKSAFEAARPFNIAVHFKEDV